MQQSYTLQITLKIYEKSMQRVETGSTKEIDEREGEKKGIEYKTLRKYKLLRREMEEYIHIFVREKVSFSNNVYFPECT